MYREKVAILDNTVYYWQRENCTGITVIKPPSCSDPWMSTLTMTAPSRGIGTC